MGIFSFGNQDDDRPKRGTRTGSRNERGGARGQARRRTERPAADPFLLDPTLPEKQRARRRLVGAIALVLGAIIILPLVLDSHPKPVKSDIAIDIPSPPASASSASADADDDTGASATDAAAAAQGDQSVLASSPGAAPAALASAPAALASAPAPAPFKPAPLATAQSTPAPAQPAPAPVPAAAHAVATPSPTQTAAEDGGDASTPASPPGSRFAVQLGTFRTEAPADTWAARLKKLGVPAYVEHRQQADGTSAIILRAGPFANRDEAAAAVAKVRGAGFAQ